MYLDVDAPPVGSEYAGRPTTLKIPLKMPPWAVMEISASSQNPNPGAAVVEKKITHRLRLQRRRHRGYFWHARPYALSIRARRRSRASLAPQSWAQTRTSAARRYRAGVRAASACHMGSHHILHGNSKYMHQPSKGMCERAYFEDEDSSLFGWKDLCVLIAVERDSPRL